ncbi:MAG: transcriptional repressor [Brevinematales bacterium]|jgi:Fur family ferric uptake transcriptional regulator
MDAQIIFDKYLKDKGIRQSEQRQKILDVFLDVEKHVTMADLYDLVRLKDKNIGYATVYRAMRVICDSGLGREVDFGDGIMRFEHSYGHAHHDHLICVECGKVIEAMDPDIEKLQEKLATTHGLKPISHSLQIFGICSDCKGH